MRFTKEDLSLEKALSKEWLITNGIGGFASSTILGANTRKYHGLLIAPLEPPARRHLVLAKIDESIEIDGEKYGLYTNVGEDYISKGFEYQTSFQKKEIPIFEYQIQDIKITKKICMAYGKNTVGVFYEIENGVQDVLLNLAPIMNFRDFHSMNTNHEFELKQQVKQNKVKIIIDEERSHPIYLKVSEGSYQPHERDTFYHMFYLEEQKRGFYPEENHSVTGVFQISIKPGEKKEISLVCSLEENIDEITVKDLIEKEQQRCQKICAQSGLLEELKTQKQLQTQEEKLKQELLLAADQFLVYRPAFRLHTILAGYPWFLDWGRDSLIAFEGLLLLPRRYEIAKEVLLTMVRDIKYGLVPNGYSGFDNRPLYNSVDASLLLFEQVQKYLDYTGDEEFVKQEIYPKLISIIENYQKGIDVDDNNIYLDTDYLLVCGTENTQNTWMDAKVGYFAVTPRNGKAVEINSMWYNSLKIMEQLTTIMGTKTEAKKYKDLANRCQIAFHKFYHGRRKCLYDVLGDSKLRPNQLFALSLTYPIIDPNSEKADIILETVEKKLLNAYGLKTLAKGEENYVEVYEGNGEKRDKSYHQGITWPWLLGLYFNSLENQKKVAKTKKRQKEIIEKIEKFRKDIVQTFQKEIDENGCLGSIAEIYDSKKPQLPKGAFAQAWSVAEILRIIVGK